MYLVHARFDPPPGREQEPPADIRQTLSGATLGVDGLEHVAVHTQSAPSLTLGLYLRAPSLEEAERRAAALCRWVVEDEGALRGWRVGAVGVPMVTPVFERMMRPTGPGDPPGRNGPGPNASR